MPWKSHRKGLGILSAPITEKKYLTWITLTILLGAQFVMSMGSFSFGPLAPFLRDAFGISRGQVGSLIAIFYFTCTIAAIPAGIFVDRLGARPMLILCLFLEGVPYAAMTLSESYAVICICFALSGVGYGFINQVSTKGIMNWFPPATRATAMGVKQAGVNFGAAAAAWMLPAVAVAWNWKAGVLLVGISMFVMAVLCFVFYREHPSAASVDGQRVTKNISIRSLFAVLSQPTLLALMLIVPFLAFSHGAVVSFLVLYLKEEIHFPVALAGKCLTVSMVAAAMGRICWGVVSDRMLGGNRLMPVILISLIGAISAMGMALLNTLSSPWLAFFWAILLGLSLSGWNAMVMVLSAELGGMQLAASVVSAVVTVVGIGFLVGPVVFGYVADRMGYFSSWMLVVITSLLSLGGFMHIDAIHRKNR